ncbi:hypothetical protein AQS8620_00573 [Aquimixticola soesokkakensis]|uniref:Lipid/polyisoprenoid-binding YceI-like domain-containing protein n=1 Tax=Aquimixticola soesokkakensis TaxID=1519096 RepID=A0A1Y5RMV4_9RHOB|nr:cytochrome b/b6 domain-containing protein [Aquimixticola soesokkakensis]SLN21042.1 hypothetical protein AQS8620_00573 [Aquimixticola soesokkakensis]
MIANTATRYGTLARFFHWAIALLILTDIALGLYGDSQPRNAETVDMLKTLYSAHKTIGVTVLGLAVLRILWALIQPRPVALHPERRMETLAAETVHWALYGAIVIMPLSGWVLHSAEAGFAPIWWPFGQNLPFVPKSESLAHTAGAVHGLAAWVIYVTVALHVLGALKHALIDRDATLSRMTRGVEAGTPATAHGKLAPVLALLVWVAVLGVALLPKGGEETAQAAPQTPAPAAAVAEAGANSWRVTEGTLGFTVRQMGAQVGGSFADWTADIAYDPDSQTGSVTVVIDMTSVSLGTVTEQAKGAEFFNTDTFQTATFAADIVSQSQAVGTLTLVGQSAPVTLAFTLDITGDTAVMQGTTTLDRRDFGIGQGYGDEATVGFAVDVAVSLTATRN